MLWHFTFLENLDMLSYILAVGTVWRKFDTGTISKGLKNYVIT